jgi:16S rRNA (guanine1207-N2)-methyltransferase
MCGRWKAETGGGLDFIVMNPPFHDGGAEDRRLGQAFIKKAAEMLRKGGVLWLVANRHLPYEAELKEAFKRVNPVGDGGGYKLFEAVK